MSLKVVKDSSESQLSESLVFYLCSVYQVAGATTPEPVAYACELCKRNGKVLKGAKPGQPSEGYDTAFQKSLAAPRTVPSPLEGW